MDNIEIQIVGAFKARGKCYLGALLRYQVGRDRVLNEARLAEAYADRLADLAIR